MRTIIFLLSLSVFSLLQVAGATGDIVILGLFRDKAVLRVDGRQYVLSPGDSVDDVLTLVSADSQYAILEISGERRRYTLGAHISSNFNEPPPRITVTIAPDRNGMYLVNGSINKYQTRFIVDTGATLVSMNRHDAERFGIDYKLRGRLTQSNTASGPDTIYIISLNSVTVGGIRLNDITAAVHDGDYPETILLGNSFLNNVSIRRDGQLLLLSR